MPGLVPGIHVFSAPKQVVDGRDKPGHDADETKTPARETRTGVAALKRAYFS